ncbi:septum site-determining protein MinC [Paratissierella segnis]|uniref:Probable septum site-determining protein MinC n=1 Tax=Paratissierella segnis TaxID=2763679 RepID=A0A926IKZ9_9FIRM|nr:septum site-determining protein MinC [Paratissierella segnis]MBC8588840.1 septum site-determining protein MinC [Paratissierella segnis]
MKRDLVCFKGAAEGVYLDIKGKDFEAIKKELDDKMKNSYKFFEGAKFLGVRCDELTQKQLLEITLILKYKYDFNISKDEILDSLLNVKDNFKGEADCYSKCITDEGKTKFIYGTLRSGQTVEYDGNIVIIGDVNPGAFLKAKGNIIVLGTLRGVAQAGDGGDEKAVVAAYCLLPTQLRIGDIIVRSPDGDMQYKLPEIARIIDGKVLIEPYLPNK